MQRSRTLRRLGVAGLGAATFLSTPWIGAVGTALAAPVDSTVQLMSQQTGSGSTKNDGTNTSIKLSANVTQASGGGAQATSVRFTYTQTAPAGATNVVIGVDNTAPFSVEWTSIPTNPATYTLTAEALGAGNTVIDQDINPGVAVDDQPSVHISSPADGDSIGEFNDEAIVKGTRSSDLPTVAVTATTRNNDDGTIVGTGGPGTVVYGTGTTAQQQQWSSTDVDIVPCPGGVTSCDVFFTATAGAPGPATSSDEVVQAHLYAQTLTTFTVTPTSQTKPVNTDADYLIEAKDQNGKPIGDLDWEALVASDPAPPSLTPGADSGTTDANGQDTLTEQNSDAETATLTVRSVSDGVAFNGAVDFSRTITLITYVSTPTTLTISADPQKDLYALDNEYTASVDNATPGTPEVDVCITDQNGQPFDNGTTPANLQVSRTRTTTTGGTTTGPTTTSETPVADTRTGFENCFIIPHPNANGVDYGTETFDAFVNNNGTPGYQPGTSDVAAGSLTLKFSDLVITDSGDTQQQINHTATVTFTVLGANGEPFVGREIAVSITAGGGANFPTTQPAGTTRNSPTTATGVTDANGQFKVNVDDSVAENVTVTADDVTDAANDQVDSGASDSVDIEFRTQSVALTDISLFGSPYALYPGGPDFFEPGMPGVPVVSTFEATDINGQLLRNTDVAVSVDNGFLTPNPTTASDYDTLTFDPAPAAGANAGHLKSLGTSHTYTTDGNGHFTVTFGDGRDVGFDDDGYVLVTATFTANGGSDTFEDPSDGGWPGTFSTDNFNGPVDEPLNPASATILPATPDDVLSGKVQGDTPTGNNGEGVNFIVELRDDFGNLVRVNSCNVDITVNAPGELSDDCTEGSYDDDQEVINLSDDGSASTAGDSVTVTVTWTNQTSKFKANGTPPPAFNVDQSDDTTETDSFTVTIYGVDLQNLHYAYSLIPGHIVVIRTAVSEKVVVTDQFGAAVGGLEVDFYQSGPGTQNDNFNCGITNDDGAATATFSSSSQGNSQLTVVVTDDNVCFGGGSGNELSRSTQKVGFDGNPTIHAKKHINKPAKVKVHGFTRGGASIVLMKKTKGGSWNEVASKKANSDGSYSFKKKIKKTTKWKVRVDDLVTSVVRKTKVG